MKKMKVINLMFVAVMLLFWSCQSEQLPVEVENNAASTTLNRIVEGATLIIDIERLEGGPYTLEVYKVSEEWKEDQISWNSRITNIPWANKDGGGTYDLSPAVKYKITKKELLEIPITKLFEDGVPQYGLLLKLKKPQGHDQYVRFVSREGKSTDELIKVQPKVVVQYGNSTDPSGDTFPIIADASMWNQFPNRLLGSIKRYIFVGNVEGYEMRCVVNFDIPGDILPGESNCTHTKAYWKTHAKRKKKDPIWDELKPDGIKTKFFLSGKSYHKVMWTPPKKGNVYYILAHQYIATELNILSGADDSDIRGVFNEATVFFNTYTPKEVEKFNKKKDKKETRKYFLELAKILNKYNTGDIGPGHCDDHKWKKKDKEWKKWWKDKWGKWKKKP